MGMKKGLVVVFSLLVGVSVMLAGCGSGASNQASGGGAAQASPSAGQTVEAPKEVTLKVGAAPVPHAEILEFIKPKLKEEGVNLEVVILDDEGQLNPALKDNQIDANFFQHVPYLDSVRGEKGFDFAVTTKVHVEPIGFYSDKLKSAGEIKEGAKIGIPNNPSNEFRALTLLQEQGLIKLKDGLTTYEATPKDIAENPKKLEFIEAEAATLPRALPDLDGAVINTNVVLEAKIDPNSALFREGANSPYANVIVVRKGDENREEIKKLDAALTTPEVKKFIEDKYGVAVVPAF
ncbi:MetQ/NlpA family ABC transporter substrate-binding protein [Brevibacillus centrosporus]|uniref:Lipoprotein n=1 Tax=Brevibacillus centrosporus TaxID=54910 RepID=A0A1I3MG66_9BACL|nr:MetQ/NlpA family ABC transporter substrate-binding protein [Brevibacillus centrosporus]MED4911865.1 MetQ/NlpA family ABC transporter substrate-binding protein [Brevibacillus centrosporus]SFI95978.1 D-methionine transport system substrate-binding protein [Brevibacillus centrosporus]